MRGLSFEIKAFGVESNDRLLRGVGWQLVHLRHMFEAVESILAKGEQRIFQRLHGRYVDTGALMGSLTEDRDPNALREVRPGELYFGSHLKYAKYQRDRNKSAVLKLLPTERKEIGAAMLASLLHGRHG